MKKVTTRALVIESSNSYLAEPLPSDWDTLREYELFSHILDYVDSVFLNLRPADVMFLITLSAKSMEEFLWECGIGVENNTRRPTDDNN